MVLLATHRWALLKGAGIAHVRQDKNNFDHLIRTYNGCLHGYSKTYHLDPSSGAWMIVPLIL
jgi:hypothetical protein